MDGQRSLLQTRLLPPPPLLLLLGDPEASLFQLLRQQPWAGPAVAVAATVPTDLPSEATTGASGSSPFHGSSWSALSREKTCLLRRGYQMMELRKSIGDVSSRQGGP